MITYQQIYVLAFIALSTAIGFGPWLRQQHALGLILGLLFLLLSLILGVLVESVSGSWFALEQDLRATVATIRLEGEPSRLLLLPLLAGLGMVVESLALSAFRMFPGLSLHLGVTLVFLAYYLFSKSILLLLGRLLARAIVWRRRQGRSSFSSLPFIALGSIWRIRLLTSIVIVLMPVLAALPYLMPLHPGIFYIGNLFWAGIWVLLLELRQLPATPYGAR